MNESEESQVDQGPIGREKRDMSKRGGPIVQGEFFLVHARGEHPELFCGALNELDWELDMHGVQIYPADDRTRFWIRQSCKCQRCGHTWEAVAPHGSRGIECPRCHAADWWFEWKER